MDVLCFQETHLSEDCRFSIRDFQCFIQDRVGHKWRIIIMVISYPYYWSLRNLKDSKHLAIKLYTKWEPILITNLFCPNTRTLNLNKIQVSESYYMIVRDFNSHSSSWGYMTMDSQEKEVEDWITENQKTFFINEPQVESTFCYRWWKSQSMPDLAIATENIQYVTESSDRHAGSDLKSIVLTVNWT